MTSDDTIQMMADHGTFLVSTTYLTEAMAIERIAPELRKKAEEVFPQAKAMLPKAIAAAFEGGALGILDYYKLRNIQADTEMRRSISGVTTTSTPT